MKKIAIGIPAYKAHKTIGALLESIDIQTMRDDIEVIIVNDNPATAGNPPFNAEESYSGFFGMFPKLDIKEVYTDKNSGPGVARNKAIETAQAEYIMFCDADDVLFSPLSVEQLYNGVKARPDIIQCQGVFIQESHINGQHKFIPQNNPNHPWSFGRLTNLQFLKQMGIRFGTSPNMEDGFYQWCVNLAIEGTPLKRNFINEIVYVWKEGSEHSITRSGTEINDGIPVYNYSMCQIGASVAAKQAVEFSIKKNPFNGSVQKFLLEQMIGHYFTYYECLEKCQKFADQNWWLSKWFYHRCYKKYGQNIPQEVVNRFFMQMLSAKAPTLSKFPDMTFDQWFEAIKTEPFKMEELVEIRNRLPKEILDCERKSGSLTNEARDNALNIFTQAGESIEEQ